MGDYKLMTGGRGRGRLELLRNDLKYFTACIQGLDTSNIDLVNICWNGIDTR